MHLDMRPGCVRADSYICTSSTMPFKSQSCTTRSLHDDRPWEYISALPFPPDYRWHVTRWHLALRFLTALLKGTYSGSWDPSWRAYISNNLGFSDVGNTSIASHHHPMVHCHPESNWRPPPVDRILYNVDAIYAAGVFWRVVSPQLLESQSRLMSAVTLMADKLKAALHPHDLSSPESRPQRYTPRFNRKSASFT